MNRQLSFNLDFRPAYKREDFFVGDSNQEAILSIDRWPDWGVSPFMVIYGEEGSGKKHIASVWQARSNAVVLDARSFPDVELTEILAKKPNIILHQLHLILDNRELEEKLFHIYNSYIQLPAGEKKHVLMTSRIPPGGLDFAIPDLRSRIMGSRIVSIRNPDDDLLKQVLGKQLHDKGFQPTEELLNYALKLMERSWTMPKLVADKVSRIGFDTQKGLTKRMIRDAILSIEEGNQMTLDLPKYPDPKAAI